MVEGRSQINAIITRYREELARTGVKVGAVYLYGSYAHGLAHEDSDIDLIIVSIDFEGMNIRERLELLGLTSARILEPIQAYGLTPEEIEKHQLNSFWSNILENEAMLV
jgi:predicted nucleotidyltransferase